MALDTSQDLTLVHKQLITGPLTLYVNNSLVLTIAIKIASPYANEYTNVLPNLIGQHHPRALQSTK